MRLQSYLTQGIREQTVHIYVWDLTWVFFRAVEGLFQVTDTEYILKDSGLKGQRGVGYARDFSTANPTSAYDTANFGKASYNNKDLVENPLQKGVAVEDIARQVQEKTSSQKTYAMRTFSNFAKWRNGETNFNSEDGDGGNKGSG